MTEQRYGDHTSVTVTIPRLWVAGCSVKLLAMLGNVWLAQRTVNRAHVYLPDGVCAFGLVSGAVTMPAVGSYVDLRQGSFYRHPHVNGVIREIKLPHMGSYFGWCDPSGVRVEFHTLDGVQYKLTISYQVLSVDGADGLDAYRDETRKLDLIRWLIGHGHRVRESWATALTPRAAREIMFTNVRLGDFPAKELVLRHIPD